MLDRNQARRFTLTRTLEFLLIGALVCCSGDARSSSDAPSPEGREGPFTHLVNRNANAPLVEMRSDGERLHYGLYRERGAASARNIVPDFSRAGYRGGGVSLPTRLSIPVLEILEPDANGDDYPRIQAAIDAVGARPADGRGVRGAVLLRRGHYTLSQTLIVRSGGVVLRGEGRSAGGTVIRSEITERQGRIIDVGEGESPGPSADREARRTTIAMDYVPVGAMRIELESAAGYRVGDTVAIVREPNARWLGPEGIDTARYGWTTADYAVYNERVVTEVSHNTLTLDAPIMDAIETRFGGGSVYRTNPTRISQVGIEDLRLEGNPETATANGTADTGPFTGIRLGGIRDSWVRNVTVRYVSHGFVTRNGAHFNTLEDVAYLDPRYGETQGARRYVFLYEGNSAFNLTQRCYNEGGRHTFVVGARVPGPNVFLDCVAVGDSNDSGPHHRWSTGTLYDNTKGYMLRAQNRRYSGTGHGWAGAQQMFWNTEHDIYVVQSPPFAMNWSVGPTHQAALGKFPPEEPAGIVQSVGQVVSPRSLYLQQLRDRLGKQAVINITTAAQREGRIWDSLSSRAGE
ncbi:hypothetical protein [Stenotrophomonas tumulicola]|uniref:Pectate lyase superfamily protein domain-containing protein n=1 Tax=Stenotrophomonas tumulicola TaxID=1685415 RepID=A0A7W3FP16_9GAMM|nr:hypothetical protein [Stenotrophomonas tumulicola]MBA8683054.1 hypothetical protein [Stenotrophomonas tumulicola]